MAQPYSRSAAVRFQFRGMNTMFPTDRTPANQFPIAINARAYLSDILTPRLPQGPNLLSANLPNLIHSLRRMDDTTTQPTVPVTSGPNGAGAGTDVPVTGGGAWSNPGNITVQDNNYASVTLSTSAASQGPNNANTVVAGVSWNNPTNVFVRDGNYSQNSILSFSQSGPLTITGYGFSIPSNATILGIVVTVVRGDFSGHGTLFDNTIQMHKTAGNVGQNKAKSTAWGAPPDTQTYGSSTDLWGTTWTPADINAGANGFGVFVIVNNEGNNTSTCGIDWVGVQVYYSTPTGQISDFLQGTVFGFAIGAGVTISGLTVTIIGFQTAAASGTITVQLMQGGLPVGTSKVASLPVRSNDGTLTLGNGADLWGTTWTPAAINASNFGVQIQASNPNTTAVTFNIDFISITVAGFTTPPPVNFVYVSGAAGNVFVNTTQVQSGMSGKRLALVPFRPNTSVAPWMYVGDSAKLIKIRSDGTTFKTGIAEPTTIPTLALSGAGPLTGFYQYAYVYRSSKTGAPSNPSPTAHSAGITTSSNSVSVTCTASTDPQVDLIDIYRFGVGLLNYTYLTTILNATPQYVDNLSDVQVANNPILNFNNYEPFPSIDIPRIGTLVVSASAIAGTVTLTQSTGDTFNTRWTYGTVITLSQTSSTQVTNVILFARPTSATVMIAQVQPVGATLPNGTYTFTITTPILAAQPLAALWGPTDNTAFMFGCQDPLRPGTLYFTTGNNPDAAAQTNSIELTSPTEPLIGGCIVNGLSLAMSSERGWLAYPNFAQVTATIVGVTGSPFSTIPSITDRGLVTKEGICTDSGTTAGGGTVWFISKDSIRQSTGGVGSQSITDDIYNLFPHEGQPQRSVTVGGVTVVPPDYSQPDGMALRFSQGYVYFDYISLNNVRSTLVYDVANTAWSVDVYAAVASIHADNEGMFVAPGPYVPIGDLMGCVDGTIRQLSPTGTETGNMTLATPTSDAGDERATKRFGDVYFETSTPAGVTGNVALTLYTDRYSTLQTLFAPTNIPLVSGIRQGTIIDLNSGNGLYVRDLSWVINVPLTSIGTHLHLWQPSTVMQPETTGERALDWDDAGMPGAKFVQGIVIQADTGNVPKTFAVQSGDSLIVATLAEMGSGVAFNGQSRQAFSVAVPFVTHVMRLLPLDTVPWRVWDVQWVFQPYPELAQEWHSEQISHGLIGYQHLGNINIAHISTADLTLTFVPDTGPSQVVTIPNSVGRQIKVLVIPPAFKFKLVSYNFTSAQPFRLWKEDIEVKVGQWGRSDSYQLIKPFGGESAPGAEV